MSKEIIERHKKTFDLYTKFSQQNMHNREIQIEFYRSKGKAIMRQSKINIPGSVQLEILKLTLQNRHFEAYSRYAEVLKHKHFDRDTVRSCLGNINRFGHCTDDEITSIIDKTFPKSQVQEPGYTRLKHE